jgi:hypothetical protein
MALHCENSLYLHPRGNICASSSVHKKAQDEEVAFIGLSREHDHE